jgi:hypothetical protein
MTTNKAINEAIDLIVKSGFPEEYRDSIKTIEWTYHTGQEFLKVEFVKDDMLAIYIR